MPTRQLTSARLKNLKPPVKGVTELRDGLARGLALRVFSSGRATWTFRYRPKGGGARRRIGLGDYPSVGLAAARRRADLIRGEVSGGGDPQGTLAAQREEPTLAQLIDRYLREEVRPKKKPRTVELYTHYLRRLVAPRLGSKKAHEITPGAVDNLHRAIGTSTRKKRGRPVTANRAIVALSGVYTFAARRRLTANGINPARGIEKFREQGRERYLSTDELGRLGQVLRAGELAGLAWSRESGRAASRHDRKPENRKTKLSQHVTAAFRLLLFTGCRLREILQLRWSEVDFERGLLLLPDSKTGRKTVVLNAPAVQVLAEVPAHSRMRIRHTRRRSEKATRGSSKTVGPGQASRRTERCAPARPSAHARQHRRQRRPWPADHRQATRSQACRHHRALRTSRRRSAAPRV